jgi:hypothetical protein
MNEWGNNPATLESAATAIVAVTIIFAWLSLRESKKQRRALEDEIAGRMRPWIGLFDFEFQGVKAGKAECRFLLRNFSALPAQQARLKLVVQPMDLNGDEQSDSIVMEEPGVKALMPTEDGDYTVDLARYAQMREWIGAGQDVVVNGTFDYVLTGRKFQSQFQATLWFGRNQSPDVSASTNWRSRLSRKRPLDVPVPTNWKNMSAT